MIQASVYGRIGKDPREIQTASGKTMVVASMAVSIPAKEDEITEWFGLVAFAKQAETLLRLKKGDLCSVSGRMQVNRWTDSDGAQRQQWQIVLDALVSALTTRPGGRKPAGKVREPDFDDVDYLGA